MSKQLIILCMLLYNNAGFTNLNLSNLQQDIRNEQSNQKQLQIKLQKQKQIPSKILLQNNSYVITQHNKENKDLNKLIETQNNQNLLIQQIQSQDVGQSQILMGEDYQVINFTNPQILKTQASQDQSQQNINSQIIKIKDDNNQLEFNSQNDQRQSIEIEYDDKSNQISDLPLDFDLINNSKQLNKLEDQNSKQLNKLEDQSTSQNQESNINSQSDIQYKIKEVQDEQIQDQLKVGYIIENNVETNDYLKDIEQAENNYQQQQNVKQKLEQEQQYLKQLKINEQDNENKLKQLKEQEQLIYDQEQNQQQQIKYINEQLQNQEQELQQINDDKNINTQFDTNEQTQFSPYEGQELIISSEVNYDEGNIEQFQQTEYNQIIEEKAETLEIQNNEQVDFYWNQNTQYQETFEQNKYISNSEKEGNDIQNFDQSIPAQPQEISIDLNLKSNDLTSQINLSKDVLITSNNEQVIDQSLNSNLEDNLNQNNQNKNNNQLQQVNMQNKDENMTITNPINNSILNKKEKQGLNQNYQDDENQIINFEDYNQQSNLNSEITLAQNNNYNQDLSNQSDNILKQQNYHEQIKQFKQDQSFYQIQQLIKRNITKTNLRGSIQDIQQPSLLFQSILLKITQ